MAVTWARRRYGVKLGLGYVATAALLVSVGATTNDVTSTVVAGIAGLLTLGSINAAETIASVKEIAAQTEQIADGNLEQEVSSTRVDEFGMLASSIEDMRQSLRDRLEEMERTRTELEAAQTEAEEARQEAEKARQEAESAEREARELAAAYQATAERYGETMEAAATGDLTERVDVDTEREAMETVGTAFNQMMDDLQSTVQTVAAVADDIEAETAEMSETSADIEASIGETVASVSKIESQADEQRT
jgi:methyl-accepting chemotaxis protein